MFTFDSPVSENHDKCCNAASDKSRQPNYQF